MQNPYIEKKLKLLASATKSGDTLAQFKIIDDIYNDGIPIARE
jgi:hypothetical protein